MELEDELALMDVDEGYNEEEDDSDEDEDDKRTHCPSRPAPLLVLTKILGTLPGVLLWAIVAH